MKKYLTKNRYLILAGVALTALAILYTYKTRGYFAVGGEWLLLPAMLMCDYLAGAVMQDIFDIINFEDGDEE